VSECQYREERRDSRGRSLVGKNKQRPQFTPSNPDPGPEKEGGFTRGKAGLAIAVDRRGKFNVVFMY